MTTTDIAIRHAVLVGFSWLVCRAVADLAFDGTAAFVVAGVSNAGLFYVLTARLPVCRSQPP